MNIPTKLYNQSSSQPTQEYYNFSQHFSHRPSKQELAQLASALNKENKQANAGDGKGERRAQKDHYQSHREFGRDLSNSNNHSSVNAKIGNTNSTTNQASANISLFKNFISQYQSQNSGPASKAPMMSHLQKLDLNQITLANNSVQTGGNSSRGGRDDLRNNYN